jgi:uncharacterized membrane protein YbhN (UPF0104 family)
VSRRWPWSTVGKLAVSAALIGFLGVRYGGDPAFRRTLGELDLRAFFAAEAVVAGGLFLSALRWKILLRAAGVSLGFWRSLRLYLVGYFFNFFLPTTVGGDVVRAMGLGSRASLPVVGGSIVVERILGFGCLLVIGILASFGLPSLAVARGVLLLSAALYVGGLALILLVPLPPVDRGGWTGRILGGLRRTALEIRSYGFHGAALGGGLLLSLGWQLSLVAANAILSRGLGGVAPLKSLLALIPVVQAITMIPVSFGGLGIREVGYEYFFRSSGFDPAGAVALGVGWLGVTIALALKGGLVYLTSPVGEREA